MMDEEFLLPKTIRQIGDIQGRLKICLEDFVMTYIRKKEQQAGENYLGILLGERRRTKQADYVLIRGILEVEETDCQPKRAEEADGRKEDRRAGAIPADGRKDGCKKREPPADGRKESHSKRELRCGGDGEAAGNEADGEKDKILGDQAAAREGGSSGWNSDGSDHENNGRRRRKSIWDSIREEESAKPETHRRFAEAKTANSETENSETSDSENADSGYAEKKPSALNIWERLRRNQEMYFPGWEVQGCCVIGVCQPERMKQLTDHVPDAGRLLYHLQDREERLYQLEEGRYQGIRGYFVFYEQNRRMQEYMEEVFREERVEGEAAPERAVRSFREKIRSMSEEKSRSFLKLAGSFFVITVLIIGAVVVNRLDDIRTAENLAEAEGEAVSAEGRAEQAANTSSRQAEESLPGSDDFWEDDEEAAASANADAGSAEESVSAAAGISSQTGATGSDEGTTGTAGSAQAAASGAEEAVSAEEKLAQSGEADPDAETTGAASASSAQTADSASADSAALGSAQTADSASADSAALGSAPETAEDGAAENAAGSLADSQEASSRQIQAAYVIREGDTLADICKKYYGNLDRLEEICEVNAIEDADRILPGQKIVLP